jgi:hypothetical protein
MSQEETKEKAGAWILFPEIGGIALLAVLLPLPLIHFVWSGHVLAGSAGLLLWLAAVVFAVRCIRRRQYGLAYLPMLAILGLFVAVYKLSQ